MSKTVERFDYIIIGNGLAGFQLALKIAEDSFFDSKTIAMIDPSEKTENDKSWSFWEKGKGQWDRIVEKQWDNAKVITSQKSLNLDLNPYIYKTIKSIDFYNHSKSILDK
ncbi:MAG: lycopene cyclase family protein, partial [Bacteroidota bacterium]